MLYTTSTLYHSIQKQNLKGFLQNLDHSAIYLLIAGTYTPFTLRSPGDGGFSEWFEPGGARHRIAVHAGGAAESRFADIVRRDGLVRCCGVKPLVHSVDAGGILLLVLGGAGLQSWLLVGVFIFTPPFNLAPKSSLASFPRRAAAIPCAFLPCPNHLALAWKRSDPACHSTRFMRYDLHPKTLPTCRECQARRPDISIML